MFMPTPITFDTVVTGDLIAYAGDAYVIKGRDTRTDEIIGVRITDQPRPSETAYAHTFPVVSAWPLNIPHDAVVIRFAQHVPTVRFD